MALVLTVLVIIETMLACLFGVLIGALTGNPDFILPAAIVAAIIEALDMGPRADCILKRYRNVEGPD